MESSKWRISKACEVCRQRKLRCNGEDPCERCRLRNLACVYREKARNRPRKHRHPPASTVSSLTSPEGTRQAPATEAQVSGDSPSIHVHSVAATHRASPSCVLQLYYGPSSNFSMLHSIYHQIEGTRFAPGSVEDAEEVGPGLDLFSNRRLFFGDLADDKRRSTLGDNAALILDHARSKRYIDRYLETYWNVIPVPSKEEYRRRLDKLWEPPSILTFDSLENIILALAMAMGACTMDEENMAELLFQKAKQGASKLDELVNIQAIQVPKECARPTAAYLHTGTAVRKAVAAGLHKSTRSGSSQSVDETQQRHTIFWSLYFWETWISLSLGRPSSICEPSSNIPIPNPDSLLCSLVALSRIMSTCASRIHKQDHESLLSIWTAANDIRRDLLAFAEQQREVMGFEMASDPQTGEKGVWQTIISTMYHHTFILTFRPFVVLRAKMKNAVTTATEPMPQWLDIACEYSLEEARRSINFLTHACEQNALCRAIKYHSFFVEGACWVLSCDMLRDRTSCDKSLPWVRVGLKTLETILKNHASIHGHPAPQVLAVERMIQGAVRAFQLNIPATEEAGGAAEYPRTSHPSTHNTANFGRVSEATSGRRAASPTAAPPPPLLANVDDTSNVDMDWNIDFGAMDMEAFLSIDVTQDFNFGV